MVDRPCTVTLLSRSSSAQRSFFCGGVNAITSWAPEAVNLVRAIAVYVACLPLCPGYQHLDCIQEVLTTNRKWISNVSLLIYYSVGKAFMSVYNVLYV